MQNKGLRYFKLFRDVCKVINYSLDLKEVLILISGLADMGGIAIDNARMYDHLKAEHEKLIDETHRWFEYGKE